MPVLCISYGPAFSSLVRSWVFLWTTQCLFPLQGLFRILMNLFSYLSLIKPFYYVPILNTKFFFSLYPIIYCPRAFSMFQLAEFSFIILECSVLFALFNTVSLSFKSSFFRQYQRSSRCTVRQLFWSFHPNIFPPPRVFHPFTLLLVVTISLPDLLV